MYPTGFEAVGEMWDLKLEVLEGFGGRGGAEGVPKHLN